MIAYLKEQLFEVMFKQAEKEHGLHDLLGYSPPVRAFRDALAYQPGCFQDCTLEVPDNHRVYFKVSKTLLLIYNRRSQQNVNPVLDDSLDL